MLDQVYGETNRTSLTSSPLGCSLQRVGKKGQQDYTVKMKSTVKIDAVRWHDTYGGDGWKLKITEAGSEVEAVMPGSSKEDAAASVKGNLGGTFPNTEGTWELVADPTARTTSGKYVREKKSKYYS